MRRLLLVILSVWCLGVDAQVLEDTSIFKYPINMDAVTIKASRDGWDVKGFIERVQHDTTFYKAFLTMRLMPYTATNDIKVFNKKEKVQASFYNESQQYRRGNCRTMSFANERVTGNFYKRNGDYRYYTADLYAYMFFIDEQVCGEDDIVGNYLEREGSGQKEKHIQKLKMLIFNPGSDIGGIPLTGNKAVLFDPDVAKMYDFKLLSEEYNGVDCYVFQLVPKPEYADKVIYNNLATWFRKSDYSIVARDYSLSYNTPLYDFDVVMKVRTQLVGGKLVPNRIDYDGNWHIFTQKRERVKFSMSISY